MASGAGVAAAGRTALASPVLAVVLAMLFWSITPIVVRYVHADVPPMGLSFWRSAVAFALLLPFTWRPLLRQWPTVRPHLPLLALLSLLLWVGGNALLVLSLQFTIAINAAVINSVEPVIIILVAALLFRDRLGWKQAVGIALSLGGVLVLISGGSLDRLLLLDFNKGDLIVTCAYISWGCYAVLLRKLPPGLDGRVVVIVLIGIGGLLILPLYLIEIAVYKPILPTPVTVLTVIGLAVFASMLALLFWNYGLTRMGAIRTGHFLHLIPAFSVILALTFLSERLGTYHIVGIVLIAAGILFASRK
ncbi:MAG: DMT family transporter [Bauldia litoralis]